MSSNGDIPRAEKKKSKKHRDSPSGEKSRSHKHHKSESSDVSTGHKKSKHSSRHHRSPDVSSESDHSRPSSANHRPKSRGSRTHSDDDSESHLTDSTNKSSTAATKKTMLKYMIHEVRELKRQLDPNAPDVHIWHKREKKRSDSETDGDADKQIDGRRRLPVIPDTEHLGQTYPPPGVESGAFTPVGHDKLNRTAPFRVSFLTPVEYTEQQLIDAVQM